MELQEFKKANNVSSIKLNKSTLSSRHIGSLMLGGNEITVMTTKTFNKESNIYVYTGEVDSCDTVVDADGNKTYVPNGGKEPCFIFSNNAGKEPDMVL